MGNDLMPFRDTAVAVYNAATTAERDRLVADAHAAMLPVMTDHLGRVQVDPKTLTITKASLVEGIVVLTTDDGVHFLYRKGEVRLTSWNADRWTDSGPVVKSLVDVGKALA